MRKFLKSFSRKIVALPRGFAAVAATISGYWMGKPIAKRNWHLILDAHCASNGRFTDRIDSLLRHLFPVRPAADASGLLGRFSINDQRGIAEAISRDGFYIFDSKLPEPVCDAIERFARTAPADLYGDHGLLAETASYDPARPAARLYKFPEAASLADEGVQALLADDALVRIAEAYMKTHVVIAGIDTWWSAPHGDGPSSEAAQLFHFDFDAPPRWLKLFVYLTDVGPLNGPHVYVKRSHKANVPAAAEIISRGYVRVPDDEIDRAYGGDAVTEITGKRGTVFFADTRGFHKGKNPTAGDRLICQLLYSSPVFCDRPSLVTHAGAFSRPLEAAIAKNPSTFRRYKSLTGS